MGSGSRRLAARPDLEQYKRRAKELVKRHAAADRATAERIALGLPRFSGARPEEVLSRRFALADAQHLIALEHGFASWARFRAGVQVALGRLLQVGDPVRITAGPFVGFTGMVGELPSVRSERRVLVGVGGRDVSVWLLDRHLERVVESP